MSKSKGSVIAPALAVVSLLFAGIGVWLYTPFLWPEATITQPGPIQSDMETSDGYPVVKRGQPLRFTISFCNPGVDINETAWLDVHESFDPGVVPPTEEPQGSYQLYEREFYFSEQFCSEERETTVRTANQGGVPDGFYSFRGVNEYNANIVLVRTNITKSEIFYLVTPGQPVP